MEGARLPFKNKSGEQYKSANVWKCEPVLEVVLTLRFLMHVQVENLVLEAFAGRASSLGLRTVLSARAAVVTGWIFFFPWHRL